MLDVNLFRNDLDNTVRRLARKKVDKATIDELVKHLDKRRALTTQLDAERASINALSKSIGQLMAQGRKEDAEKSKAEVASHKTAVADHEARLAETDKQVDYILMRLPNLPADDAPDGTSEADNQVVRTHGPDPASFAASQYKPHWEVATALGIYDGERGAKISGSMFAVLRGDGARLLRSLVRFALELNSPNYEEVVTPHFVRTETFTGTGQLPKFADDAYRLERDDLWAIPTGEVPLMGLHQNEILEESELPLRYMTHTACFRREAGAAGKDTRGMQRLHEFHKVELVKICTAAQEAAEFEALVADACRPLELLGLPYRVVDLCTADLTFGSARTFDLEVYAPGVGKWLEVSSCGIYTDFQTRRGSIRYRPGSAPNAKPQFCRAMNGSGLATPRVWAAIIEHYQQPDGTVLVPEILRPHFGGDRLTREGRRRR